MPVTTPAPGAWPSYSSYATRRPISRKRDSGSQRRVMRSRAVSFPCLCCRAILSAPPPSLSFSSSSRTSALNSRSRVTGSRFLPFAFGEPAADVVDQRCRRCSGTEQLTDPARAQRVHVFFRNDAATRDENVVAPLLVKELAHFGEQRHVRAAQDRQPDDVDVFLHGGG